MTNVKVYVVTTAELMKEEVYKPDSVFSSYKSAEKSIRARYPNARKEVLNGLTSFLCIDNGHKFLKFIREEEVK